MWERKTHIQKRLFRFLVFTNNQNNFFPNSIKVQPFDISRQTPQTHLPSVENRWWHLWKTKTDVSHTQLRNMEINARMCDAMTRRSAKNKIWHLIGAFSSERKPVVVMDEEGDDTHKRNNMNRRQTDRQTSGRHQALPHEAPESNPSQRKQSRGEEKWKREDRFTSQQQISQVRAIDLTEKKRTAWSKSPGEEATGDKPCGDLKDAAAWRGARMQTPWRCWWTEEDGIVPPGTSAACPQAAGGPSAF